MPGWSGLYRQRWTALGAIGLLAGVALMPGAADAEGTPTPTATVTATRTPAPVATSVPSPAPPKTGQAGLVDSSSDSGPAIVFVAIAVAIVAGGRLLTSRDR